MKLNTVIILLVAVAGFSIIPATASDRYLGGSPELTASVAGIDEFSPGQDVPLSVIIQNTGENDAKFIGQGTIDPDDLPTTAKLVKAALSSGMAPIIIKTDPQDIGDLTSGSSTTVSFRAKVTSDATSGEYELPLAIHYKYVANSISNQPSSDTIAPVYSESTTVIPITIRIKPAVRIAIVGVTTDNLIMGTEGYVNLTLRNDGSGDGKEASVILLRNGDSPVIPSDSSVFIGNFDQGQTVNCLYKVSVSNDARQQQTNPVDVQVAYTDSEGKIVNSAVETAGVPVGAKLGFIVTSQPASVKPGETGVIEVEYKNTGSIPAYQALARITIVEPFESSDTMAYLGDVAPGQTVVGKYTISATSNAVPATYQLDTNVRYRDTFDNSLISDTVSAPVEIVPVKRGISPLPVAAALIGIIGIGVIAYLYIMKKRR